MASPRSAHSSEGYPESVDGRPTPDTTLTTFSPEDARPRSVNRQRGAIYSALSSNDVFVSPATSAYIQQTARQLSATASEFQPSNGSTQRRVTQPATHLSAPGSRSHHGRSSSNNTSENFGIFTNKTGASRYVRISSMHGHAVTANVIRTIERLHNAGATVGGHPRLAQPNPSDMFIGFANIIDAHKVFNMLTAENPSLTVEFSSATICGPLVDPGSQDHSDFEGQVLVMAQFTPDSNFDSAHFDNAIRALLTGQGDICAWEKQYSHIAGMFVMVAEFYDASLAPMAAQRLHGQDVEGISITVALNRPDIPHNRAGLGTNGTPTRNPANSRRDSPEDLANSLGDFSIGGTHGDLAHRAGQMFADSNTAVMAYGNTGMNSQQYGMNQHQPQTFGVYSAGNVYLAPAMTQTFGAFNGGNNFNHSLQTGFYGGFQRGYQGQSTQMVPYSTRASPRQTDLHQNQMIQGSSPRLSSHMGLPGRRHHERFNSGGPHNYVDIERIRRGLDVRSTVMLRNIPNKLNQIQLKEIIDSSSWGLYDFCYLRIDFSNGCNVGYAFINFTDPLDIIAARAGQRWGRIQSDKIAEVSYASGSKTRKEKFVAKIVKAVQGKECLIQKFRNSSVMLEPPHCRPKLFYTIHDDKDQAGQEEPFPDADNSFKLQRSCQNAENVGLFAPNAGQHVRDEQRRRRSQFDRGTSMATRDERAEREEREAYDQFEDDQ